jgi:predicted nucleic acid-binding protein
VIDASVHVADARPQEPHHAEAGALLARLAAEGSSVYLPEITLAKVAAAISPGAGLPSVAQRWVAALRRVPHFRFVPVDAALGDLAAWISAQYVIRGCDAVYVVLAQQRGGTLITLDRQQRERVPPQVVALTPAEELAVHLSCYSGPCVVTRAGPPVFTQTGPVAFTRGGPPVFPTRLWLDRGRFGKRPPPVEWTTLAGNRWTRIGRRMTRPSKSDWRESPWEHSGTVARWTAHGPAPAVYAGAWGNVYRIPHVRGKCKRQEGTTCLNVQPARGPVHHVISILGGDAEAADKGARRHAMSPPLQD